MQSTEDHWPSNLISFSNHFKSYIHLSYQPNLRENLISSNNIPHVPVHRSITRKFAAQIAKNDFQIQKEVKKTIYMYKAKHLPAKKVQRIIFIKLNGHVEAMTFMEQ